MRTGPPTGVGPPGFDAAYVGTPPWNIGGRQEALLELAEAGELHGRVLGTGEHALMAAGLGLDATGVDTSPRAIIIARTKAEGRGLSVRFLVSNALNLGGLGEHFDTVLDSGLFQVFDDAARSRYIESLRSVMLPGADTSCPLSATAKPVIPARGGWLTLRSERASVTAGGIDSLVRKDD